jgi:hypothetical protein
MGSAGGRSGQGGLVPEWAWFLDPAQFQAFVDLVTAELERSALPYAFDVEAGVVRLPKRPEMESAALGLVNLAQVCHRTPLHTWPAIVGQHMARSLDLAREPDDSVSQIASDFDQARQRLKVRLYPADVGDDVFLTLREPMDGVRAVLVYDLPETIHSVQQEHVALWQRPLDELFAIALANVKAGDPVDRKSFPIDETAALTLLSGGSYFTASHALFLEDYLTPAPELGAIVAVPHRHALIYHPIVDQGTLVALSAMIPMARGMCRDGPGSISPHLFWWRDGRFTLLPCTVTESSVRFNPPDEFAEILSRFVT